MNTCQDCGIEVSTAKTKRCQPCYHKSRRSLRVDKVCENCGKEFQVTENDHKLGKGQFCCRPCRSAWRKHERKKRNAKECEVCGDTFYPKPAYVKTGKAQRCSPECKGIAYQGEGNPLWSETGRRVETNGYVRIRLDSGEWVHEHRDRVEELLGRSLESEEEIHHMDRNRSNNSFDNLAILTKSQHKALHGCEDMQQEYDKDSEIFQELQEIIDVILAIGREEIEAALVAR